MTDHERPEGDVPWPKTEAELMAYIQEMIAWPDKTADSGVSYGRCVYAMANAAQATFHFVALRVGASGFQANCADLQLIVQLRGIKHGLMLLNADRLLYPSNDLAQEITTWFKTIKGDLRQAAQALIDESNSQGNPVSEDIMAHWLSLTKANND